MYKIHMRAKQCGKDTELKEMKERLKRKVAKLRQEADHKRMITEGYIKEDGTPLRCYKCESKDFIINTKDTIDGLVCEYEMLCKECGVIVGYWAYGNWML